jgi:MYXO-CTERM domain-containing protein
MFELLFVGNSYTFVNDLDLVSAEVFAAGAEPDVATTRLAESGYRWADHVAQSETAGTAWEAALVDPGEPWTWVVLQEQSQIPGFPQDDPTWLESAASVDILDADAEALGARTLLLCTWGRRLGDPDNPTLYPDFPTMQAALTEGYLAYRDQLSTDDRPVYVAPAGLAFAAVYDAVAATGTRPEDDGTTFSKLYQSDGSHPSPAGTWLVAWVVYASLTGESPIGLPLPSGIPEADAAWLQDIADEVVIGNAAGLDYAWSDGGGGSGDTGGEESGDADSGAADTAAEGSGDGAAGSGDADPVDGEGCGCATGSGDGASLLLLAAVLPLVRRRSPRT